MRTSTRSSVAFGLTITLVILLVVLLLGVLAYAARGLGTGVVIVCAIIALVPLTVVLLVVRWIDRWEPEPRLLLALALLWGAAGSVTIALLVDLGVQIAVYASGNALPSGDVSAAVLQAPLVEEVAKALGLLLVYALARRRFDGPVDGVVYAAMIGAGFAFVENILYFGSSVLAGGGEELAITFVLRGVLSPFAHVMFTACTGVALGLAARRRSRPVGVLIVLLGLALAIGLHAVWNGASFLAVDWFGFYAIVQVPLFALAVVGVVLLRLTERRITRERLGEYAAAGWFSAGDVETISTGAGRRVARAWAARTGGATPAMLRRYIDASTALAHARQRRLTGRDDIGATAEEQELLDAVLEARAALH